MQRALARQKMAVGLHVPVATLRDELDRLVILLSLRLLPDNMHGPYNILIRLLNMPKAHYTKAVTAVPKSAECYGWREALILTIPTSRATAYSSPNKADFEKRLGLLFSCCRCCSLSSSCCCCVCCWYCCCTPLISF